MRKRMRLRLLHWHEGEGRARAAQLAALGYAVDFEPRFGPEQLKALGASPPDGLVIDLTRLPSQGRDVALALRERRTTRAVPLVFAGGAAEKIERVRASLPDAAFLAWEGIGAALPEALAAAPASPIVPAHRLAGYSGTPLPQKLGIKSGMRVALVAAPEGFRATLGGLPPEVALRADARAAADLYLLFVRSRADYARRLAALAPKLGGAALWVIWPKKTSALAGDLGENEVRARGLAAGLVDFKVCAVDATWSGLKFVRRKKTG